MPSVEVSACGEFVDVRAPPPEGSCVPCVSEDISTDGSRTSFLDVDMNSIGGNVVSQGETSPVRAEIAVDAAQCCGTSTRAVNGQVRQCNSMCLLRCSCEHAEMRRYVVVRQQRTKGIGSRDTSMHPSADVFSEIFLRK